MRLSALRSSIRNRLGFSQAEARDVDAEQAFLRTLIGGGLLTYALYVIATGAELGATLQLVLVAASIPLVAGLWMLWWFRRHSARPMAMRYFAVCADLVPLTVGLWAAEDYGVPLVGFYLWVTVGNGFRFGPRMLMFSYWVSLACFVSLLLFGPFWQTHRAIGIGFALILASIPLYVLVLLSRLTAQKDAALELSNAKSRFVANVSHELRTPLTGVYAVYELLRRRRLAPDERALVGSLGSAIATLKSSVDDVLQMSKLEAGAERTDARLFNVRYFLHRTSLLIQPQAVAKRLAWALDIDPAVPATVYGDPTHLQHVVGNLINNALKFTPTGSVTLRVAPGSSGLRFEVIDTGIGIPLDKQETLFERFVQADSTATRRYGGTGLGTSIAHDLVKLMGGTIGVTSAPGRGSVFWFELPLASQLAPTPLALGHLDVAVRLIGEDSTARQAVHTCLTSLGIRPSLDAEVTANTFDPGARGVAVLVMPAGDVCRRLELATNDVDLRGCPWVVADASASSTQAAAIMRTGAAALVGADLTPEDWGRLLVGLKNSMDLFQAGIESPAEPRVVESLSILLADDNRSNQMLLAQILGDAGHKVVSADCGGDAFDHMCTEKLDLAFLDLNMPDMTGPDVIKLFRAGEAGNAKHLPIIILSADATGEARDESLAAGADDFLTKPVTRVALLSAIDRAMAGARARRQEHGAPAAPVSPIEPAVATRPAAWERAPDAASAAPSLVDSDRVESLRRIASNDKRFLGQYLGAAFEDIETAIADLRRAVSAGDARAARDALHKIDGTGASIGAEALLASARSMRNYLASASDPDAEGALAELTTICALTKSAVAALIYEGHAANKPGREQ